MSYYPQTTVADSKKRKAEEYPVPPDDPIMEFSTDDLITQNNSNSPSPIEYIKNLSREQREECFMYLKLLNYNGDPRLEEDLMFYFNAEISRIRKSLEDENCKWKRLLEEKLDKYQKYVDRLKLRIESKHFKK